MIFAKASQFHIYLPCLGACLEYCHNVKALVGASTFNQEKALVGSRGLLRDCKTSPINS